MSVAIPVDYQTRDAVGLGFALEGPVIGEASAAACGIAPPDPENPVSVR